MLMVQLTDSPDHARIVHRISARNAFVDCTTKQAVGIQPTEAVNKVGLVNRIDYDDVVTVPIQADSGVGGISIAQVPVDGARGSAMA